MENKDKFEYTYSALSDGEKRQIEDIRKRYEKTSDQKNALEEAKRLDKLVYQLPTLISLTVGIIGTMLFGLGLSLVLEFDMLIVGIVVSVVSLTPIIAAFPIYQHFLKKNKEKYGEKILELLSKQ
ncbi:MAG: hypothetical protein IJZ93_01645 [Clostridia bacterium]|nr:hypothetical protein [Clostridia bacterium]